MRICPRCSELFQDDAGFCPFDGQGLTKATDPLLGRTIAGRFRLIKRLGVGGMSSVYLARHVMIDRLSAIKILRQDLSLNPSHRERFLREARAVNRINHRNIVEITDFGDVDDLAYLVMEYVEGDSLLGHIRKGLFPWQRAARVGAQMSAALARAHQMGVIHRDLKPENVMVVQTPDYPDLVKITDFGIAKILDAPALTFTEQMIGTPGYIAPDYLEGLTPDGRADLYGLGVVLYEMISGVLPYDAKGQSELLFKPLHSAPVPPRCAWRTSRPDRSLVLKLGQAPRRPPGRRVRRPDALVDILRRRAGVTGPSLIRRPCAPTRRRRRRAPPPTPLASSPPERAPETDDDETVTLNVDAAALDQAAHDADHTPVVTGADVVRAGVFMREDAPTLVQPRMSLPTERPKAPVLDESHVTVQLGRQETSALAVRWNGALDALEVSIARALSTGGERARRVAREGAERARPSAHRLGGARPRASPVPKRVDRLAAEAREFTPISVAPSTSFARALPGRLHLASIRAP